MDNRQTGELEDHSLLCDDVVTLVSASHKEYEGRKNLYAYVAQNDMDSGIGYHVDGKDIWQFGGCHVGCRAGGWYLDRDR